ncbi:hypothetical protein KA050_00580 [Candidatus Gracilibacteria bacterium]|nr:hypothetical protein [Candidatus Gracilibacteria bacterium]
MEQSQIEVAADVAQGQLETLVREKQLQAGAVFKVINGGGGDNFIVYDPFNSSLPFRRTEGDRLIGILHEVGTKKARWGHKAA